MQTLDDFYIPVMSGKNKDNQVSVCSFLGLSRNTIKRLAKDDPIFPKCIRFGKTCIRYKFSEIRAWAEKNLGQSRQIGYLLDG